MSLPNVDVGLTAGSLVMAFSVKLDSPRKWDVWIREVHGFAIPDNGVEYLVKSDGVTRVHWYKPTAPDPVNEKAEKERVAKPGPL